MKEERERIFIKKKKKKRERRLGGKMKRRVLEVKRR
jgi:hypothetical protein